MIYEKFRDILLQECELVQKASVLQEKIRLAVTNREWTGFEGHFSAMNVIEDELSGLEKEREQLFTEFDGQTRRNTVVEKDAKGRFYAMVSKLPENQRIELTSIYRSLKLEALKMRMANDALMSYLVGINSAIKDFFDLAFPERGGKMYTPQGTHISKDMRSIVLNRSF